MMLGLYLADGKCPHSRQTKYCTIISFL